MKQAKICMLGAFCVGKTSLVARFVKSVFSDKYHSTIGVKIDKKVVSVGDAPVTLVLWDLEGEDDLVRVQMSYLRGAAGYLLVVDGTRPETLETAVLLRRRIETEVGVLPFVLLLNKCDLTDLWALDDPGLLGLRDAAATTLKTSAKTGQNVEEAFAALASAAMGGPAPDAAGGKP